MMNIEQMNTEYRMSKGGVALKTSLAQGSNPVSIIMRVLPALAAKVG
jgi:hypothetical protein